MGGDDERALLPALPAARVALACAVEMEMEMKIGAKRAAFGWNARQKKNPNSARRARCRFFISLAGGLRGKTRTAVSLSGGAMRVTRGDGRAGIGWFWRERGGKWREIWVAKRRGPGGSQRMGPALQEGGVACRDP